MSEDKISDSVWGILEQYKSLLRKIDRFFILNYNNW